MSATTAEVAATIYRCMRDQVSYYLSQLGRNITVSNELSAEICNSPTAPRQGHSH